MISIHALRKESDSSKRLILMVYSISIHALRKESDVLGSMWGNLNLPISIHALRKESDLDYYDMSRRGLFQSTLSVRRATHKITHTHHCSGSISIHALRKESDFPSTGTPEETIEFQSTLSVRRATGDDRLLAVRIHISIHALRKESDRVI